MLQQPEPVEDTPRKITVREFLRMFEVGILDEDDRVELLDGQIFKMTPPGPEHSSTVGRLDGRLHRAYGRGYCVWCQSSLLASRWSLPQPDFAVLRGHEHSFDHRYPTGKDAVLLVEVSWTSRNRDLRKVMIYARAGVPAYWRLDVKRRLLETYEKPSRRGYAVSTELFERDSVRVPCTRKSLKIADLLPSP